MGKRSMERQASAIVNIVLVGLIFALYAITKQPDSFAVETFASPIYKANTDESISLQWVISYNASSLDPILDILEEENVRSTFMVSGKWASQNPATLTRMASLGHELGIIGMEPYDDGNLSWVTEDLTEAVSVVESLTGIRPKLYYSGDRRSATSSRACKKLDLTHVMCTLDLLCSQDTAEQIIKRAENAPSGSIILMRPTKQAAQSLKAIIYCFRSRGIEPVTTGNLIGRSN